MRGEEEAGGRRGAKRKAEKKKIRKMTRKREEKKKQLRYIIGLIPLLGVISWFGAINT